MVLCAGLKSSGSTWLYNATIQLCEAKVRTARGARPRIFPFYADTTEQFPPGTERAGLLVVKTHVPSESLVYLTRFARGTVFLSVREPRDSVASLMKRFGHEFEPCVKELAAGAGRIMELARVARPLVLRYEDRFFERPQTVPRMARRLGVTIARPAAERIFNTLTAENVRKRITALTGRGVFGARPDPDRFDPRTHWHPRHVGDGKIGKYAEVLSTPMQGIVLEALHEYCLAFGYETALPAPPQRGKPAAKAARDHHGSGIRKPDSLS